MEENPSETFLTVDYLMGHFDPSSHESFVEVDKQYADRAGLYLRKEVYNAFKRMYEAAEIEGIHLEIRSAARNFVYQKTFGNKSGMERSF